MLLLPRDRATKSPCRAPSIAISTFAAVPAADSRRESAARSPASGGGAAYRARSALRRRHADLREDHVRAEPDCHARFRDESSIAVLPAEALKEIVYCMVASEASTLPATRS